ncbi:hypothetical protein [Kutzneria sp. 744]|uniref:hypothetical protein n=1 Tax=Kutzneria sp. (strain 744) TaxID=345341 RepID=UPI0004B59F9A|nr:hypothetical protein [Kutzneria sp. 744]
MSWRFGRYPHIDLDTLRARLELFGVSERARYVVIPRRSDTAGDRDVLYLDPMRNRGR